VGSVVCPGADHKIFLTASLPERARRRRADLAARGVDMDAGRVLEDVRRRDLADSTRAASPLRIAQGAVVIDSSEMDADEVADFIVRLVEDVRAGAGAPPA
jgi:cytidylate kinase